MKRIGLVCKKPPKYLPKYYIIWHSQPAWNENSHCFTPSPACGIVSILDFGHSSGCIVVSHCFDSYFLHDTWCEVSFLIHLYIFFGEGSLKVFGPFFNQIVFLLLHFKGSLYILSNRPLSDMCFPNIVSHSVACLLIPLILPVHQSWTSQPPELWEK